MDVGDFRSWQEVPSGSLSDDATNTKATRSAGDGSTPARNGEAFADRINWWVTASVVAGPKVRPERRIATRCSVPCNAHAVAERSRKAIHPKLVSPAASLLSHQLPPRSELVHGRTSLSVVGDVTETDGTCGCTAKLALLHAASDASAAIKVMARRDFMNHRRQSAHCGWAPARLLKPAPELVPVHVNRGVPTHLKPASISVSQSRPVTPPTRRTLRE
jgi:hypothetical protein